MAQNAKLSKQTGEDEHYTFSWKSFTSWDFMIGAYETAKNKAAELTLGFRVGY